MRRHRHPFALIAAATTAALRSRQPTPRLAQQLVTEVLARSRLQSGDGEGDASLVAESENAPEKNMSLITIPISFPDGSTVEVPCSGAGEPTLGAAREVVGARSSGAGEQRDSGGEERRLEEENATLSEDDEPCTLALDMKRHLARRHGAALHDSLFAEFTEPGDGEPHTPPQPPPHWAFAADLFLSAKVKLFQQGRVLHAGRHGRIFCRKIARVLYGFRA